MRIRILLACGGTGGHVYPAIALADAFKKHYIDIDILFVGRITEQKNPLLFLDIINALNKKGMNLNVVMAGDGDLMQDVEEKIYSSLIACETSNIRSIFFVTK